MARGIYTYDVVGARLVGGQLYVYDAGGNRQFVTAGYAYDQLGDRRQFWPPLSQRTYTPALSTNAALAPVVSTRRFYVSMGLASSWNTAYAMNLAVGSPNFSFAASACETEDEAQSGMGVGKASFFITGGSSVPLNPTIPFNGASGTVLGAVLNTASYCDGEYVATNRMILAYVTPANPGQDAFPRVFIDGVEFLTASCIEYSHSLDPNGARSAKWQWGWSTPWTALQSISVTF